MRITRVLRGGFALLLLAACAGGEERTQRLVGRAQVPGALPGSAVELHAQSILGAALGSTTVAPDGSWSLTVEVPDGEDRVLLGAVVTTDLEKRALALVELSGTMATQTGALGEEEVPSGTPVDARSTAAALLRAAAGRVDLPPGDFEVRHAGAIDELSQAILAQPPQMCSIGATASTADTVDTLGRTVQQVLASDPPRDDGGPEVLRQMKEAAGRTHLTVEERLRQMQEIASYYVYSMNFPRLPGLSDTLVGFMPTVLLRVSILAVTGESLNELSGRELSRDELGRLAAITASLRWGNCREKAYLGAYAASLAPEVKQVAILGVDVQGVGAHAVAVACLDGPEVYDLSAYGGTILAPPKGAEGRCFVIDPWAPPPGKWEPGKGHVAVLSAAYVQSASWASVFVNKRVRLDDTVRAPLGEASGQVCGGAENGEPSCTAPPLSGDDATAGDTATPDAGDRPAAPPSTGASRASTARRRPSPASRRPAPRAPAAPTPSSAAATAGMTRAWSTSTTRAARASCCVATRPLDSGRLECGRGACRCGTVLANLSGLHAVVSGHEPAPDPALQSDVTCRPGGRRGAGGVPRCSGATRCRAREMRPLRGDGPRPSAVATCRSCWTCRARSAPWRTWSAPT